jgi:hypothetical protein
MDSLAIRRDAPMRLRVMAKSPTTEETSCNRQANCELSLTWAYDLARVPLARGGVLSRLGSGRGVFNLIREIELVAQFTHLEVQVLLLRIEQGWPSNRKCQS